MHERVLRLRLYYYYNIRHRFPRLWIHLREAIQRVISSGILSRYGDDPRWIHPTSTPRRELIRHYEVKAAVYAAWSRHDGGPHLEMLFRQALVNAGYMVSPRRIKFDYRAPSGLETTREFDVLTLHPHMLAFECKNKLSDVFHSPDIFETPNDDHAQIRSHFQFCLSAGLTPILAAPLIDTSFFGFIQPYRGLACRLLFQYLPPANADLCLQIKHWFKLGHVIPAASDDLPQNIQSWISKIPSMIASLDESASP